VHELSTTTFPAGRNRIRRLDRTGMTHLIYAAALILALAAPHAVISAPGEREQMQQWLNSHCQLNAANPECRQVIVRKQRVARPGKFHPYPGPIDLCSSD